MRELEMDSKGQKIDWGMYSIVAGFACDLVLLVNLVRQVPIAFLKKPSSLYSTYF